MTGYYHAKRTMLAKQYLEMREAEQRIGPADNRPARSKAWMEKYRARPRPTNFNWAPRYPFTLTPPKEPTNAEVTEKEIIEGEFTVVANADASGGEVRGDSGQHPQDGQGQGDSPSPRRRPTRTGEFETPF